MSLPPTFWSYLSGDNCLAYWGERKNIRWSSRATPANEFTVTVKSAAENGTLCTLSSLWSCCPREQWFEEDGWGQRRCYSRWVIMSIFRQMNFTYTIFIYSNNELYCLSLPIHIPIKEAGKLLGRETIYKSVKYISVMTIALH